jgi:hypothetical protein
MGRFVQAIFAIIFSVSAFIPVVNAQSTEYSTVPADIREIIEREITRRVVEQTQELGLGIDIGPIIRQACVDAGTKACKIYCKIQTEYDEEDCLDGFLWWDGCLEQVEDFCNDLI